MKVRADKNFDRNFKKRIQSNHKLSSQFNKRLKLFSENPSNSLLKNHHLEGAKKDLFSFSITGDIRVIYKQVTPEEVIFVDIGSHNQVY